MMSKQRRDSNRRLSRSTSERTIFYVNDTSLETSYNPSPDVCQRLYNCDSSYPSEDHSSFCPPDSDTVFTQFKICSQKQTSQYSNHDQRSSRRSSVQPNHSRRNSCTRPPLLGNGRRNNSTRITKSRRASIALKKDSVRPVKCEVNGERKIVEDVQDLEQARRHRRITMIILGTFLFLLAASVLAVVVTLTQSTFLTPAAGSKELAEHRAP